MNFNFRTPIVKVAVVLPFLAIGMPAYAQSFIDKVKKKVDQVNTGIQNVNIPHVENVVSGGKPTGSKIKKSALHQNKVTPDAKQGYTRYGIAGDLFVDVKGEYPEGYNPSWKYFSKHDKLVFNVDNYIAHNSVTPTESRNIMIANYEGKAALLFGAFIGCDCVADILIDGTAVLTEEPQTFKVTNFRKFANNGATGEKCVGMNNIYTAGGFEGMVTLSANEDGDINMTLMIENYRLADRFAPYGVSYRYNAENVLVPNDMSAKKANEIVAKEIEDKRKHAEYIARSQKQLDALMLSIKKKYPQKDCISCLKKQYGLNANPVDYYYVKSGKYSRTETEYSGTITISNVCKNKITLIGIRQLYNEEKGGYYFTDVTETLPVGYRNTIEHSIFSYVATTLMGVNGDLYIQDAYDLNPARVGVIQWIKVVAGK